MPDTYGGYIAEQYRYAQDAPETGASSVANAIAAYCVWMQVPDAEASTARPDPDEIEGWARRIERTKAFGRLLDRPETGMRIAAQDTEGLMLDLHRELTGPIRAREAARERRLEREREREQGRAVLPDDERRRRSREIQARTRSL